MAEENYSNPQIQSNDDLSRLDCKTIKKLGDTLDVLDMNLQNVVTQMESVKKTRDKLFYTIRKLQLNLEICGENCSASEEQFIKLKNISTDIQKREDIVKALEKREVLLSQSMLAVISEWADGVEKSLGQQ